MTYEEACEATVGRQEARREIEQHLASWELFLTEVGDRESYRGQEVLGWLGY